MKDIAIVMIMKEDSNRTKLMGEGCIHGDQVTFMRVSG
jgi:hypothetical protein